MNQSKKSISIVILLSLIFTMTFVSISQSPALECATFTGQPPSLETSETESLPPNDTSLTSEQAITVIDIAPVNQVIFASEPLPNLNCFTTSDPAAVFLAPTCTAVDGFGAAIRTTPPAGVYTILCQGGGFISGVSANFGSATLTVKAPAISASPSPTSTVTNASPLPTPSSSAISTPTLTPQASPFAQLTPTELIIDTSAPLERTGFLESCSVFTAERPLPSDSISENGSTPSDSSPAELAPIPIELKASDYRIYENMKLPTFNCTIADDPSKILIAPICFAFDGDRQLTNTPKPGLYLIQCQGGELLSGYSPNYRNASLTVLSLPRVIAPPSKSPTPSISPSPTSSSSPTPISSPTSTPTLGASTQPTTRPSTTISPTPRPTPSPKSAESVFALTSLDGQTKTVKITLPSVLVTNQIDVDVDRGSESSFFSDYVLVNPIIKRAGTLLTRFSQPIAISVPGSISDLIPVYSLNTTDWKEIPLGGADMPSSQIVGYAKNGAGEIVFYTRTSGYFGLKARQTSLNLTIPDPRSRYNPGTTLQASFAGGSGSGQFIFSSLTPSTCSVNSSGLIDLRVIGICSVRLEKAADRRYLAISSNVLSLSIESSQSKSPTPTTKPTPAPSAKPQPLPTSAPVQVQRDFVILIDPRVEVSSSKLRLRANQKSASVAINKVLLISALSLDKSSQYSLTLVLPTGSGVALTQKSFKDGVLVIQPLQLIRKGNYSLLIQNLNNNLVTVINLKAS